MKLHFKRYRTIRDKQILYEWFCDMKGVHDPCGCGQGETVEQAFEDYLYSINDELNWEGWERYSKHPEFIWLKEKGLII